MKSLFVVSILCAAIGLSHQVLTKEQIEDMLYKVMKDCARKEGASKQDVGNVAGRNAPTNTIQKCLSACIGETVGLISNGKTDITMSVELAKTAFGEGDPKVAIAEEIALECADITDPDRCEAAAKMYECGRNGAEKRGIKFEDLM